MADDSILYYYADLDVRVEVGSTKKGFVSTLGEVEKEILNQLIYLTLNCFSFIRATYLIEMAKLRKEHGG